MSSSVDVVAALKERQHEVWAAGDFDAVSRFIEEVGAEVVEAAGVRAGDAVLDVACGSGNVALQAAARGAAVTGLDLTPELLEKGRRRAEAAGLTLTWVPGDAEALPFPEESFDVVTSTFGAMFAPRHQVAADELVRVLRVGGRLALTTWSPRGLPGEMFRLMGSVLPPPPDVAEPPVLWGDEDHVRGLLGDRVELDFQTRTMFVAMESPETMVSFFEQHFGPVIMAKRTLEAEGRWGEVRERYLDLTRRFWTDQGAAQEYLLITGTRRS